MNVSCLKPEDLISARKRIASRIRLTPVMESRRINEQLGLEVYFKCEHLQHTGSFKHRGASHAVSLLPDHCPGVATHSSGNHGAALACAARERGLPAHVVMPANAVRCKVEAVRQHGGQVRFCRPDQSAREAGLAELVALGFEAVPPYDDDRIIAGQGSCALELLDQVEALNALIAPVGGGGLLAGSALAVRAAGQGVEVWGAEPAAADDTARSLASGRRVEDHRPDTIADGLRALVGERNLELIARLSSGVITVSEGQIIAAMSLLWSELKQVIEPSGAVALAALMADCGQHPERWRGRRVGIILSGGNLDIAPMLRGWQS